jgi:hypothetical protein
MKLQTQPNKFSCLITSLAILLNEDVNDLIIEVGGSNENGNHIQQLSKLCLKRNKALIQFDMNVNLYNNENIIYFGDDIEYINNLMKTNDGILLGQTNDNKDHATCWNHLENCIYDPNGGIYAKGFFTIESFLLLKDLK